jgi:hypothetical protein
MRPHEQYFACRSLGIIRDRFLAAKEWVIEKLASNFLVCPLTTVPTTTPWRTWPPSGYAGAIPRKGLSCNGLLLLPGIIRDAA